MNKSIIVKGKENDVVLRLFQKDIFIDEIHIQIEGEKSWTVIGFKDLQNAIAKAEKKFNPKGLKICPHCQRKHNETAYNVFNGSAFSIHDLKCGNILNYDTAEGENLPTVIDWQDLKWLTEDPIGFNLVHSPIPLTEEWLIKFGFNLIIKEGNQGDFRIYQLNEITYNNTNNGWWWENRLIVQPKYIHELQNLYYCLTDKLLITTKF